MSHHSAQLRPRDHTTGAHTHTEGISTSAREHLPRALFLGLTMIAASLLPILCSGGCSKTADPPRSPAKPASPAIPSKSYTVRGVIEALPVPDKPGTQLIIHHQEIPDFVHRDGRIGMKAMGMPFPLGDGVGVEGLAIGDPVEFEFTVDWASSEGYWITRISRANRPSPDGLSDPSPSAEPPR